MRLLKVSQQSSGDDVPELVEFLPDSIPPYAILSHRWSSRPSDEISFADLAPREARSINPVKDKHSYHKLQSSCEKAREHGLHYLWIDTCCIDKSSSAELSEAINSMYTWYQRAQVCLVYLADVPSTVDLESRDSELTTTTWATRGWTLQELLAPSHLIFYSTDWREIGTRESLSGILSTATGIDEEYLATKKPKHPSLASVAKRMSWAARRTTSRPEDMAYCLMGLFEVNMPMLYGEGHKAFIRLQEEIMRHSDDHSLFAWTDDRPGQSTGRGLLADHPRCFRDTGNIVPYQDHRDRAPFVMSNRGLRIELELTYLPSMDLYAAALECPIPPFYDDSTFLAIYLRKLPFSHGQYARVKTGSLGEVKVGSTHNNYRQGKLETIYVRQFPIVPDVDGIFPIHALQLHRFIVSDRGYRVARTFGWSDSNSGPVPVPEVHTAISTTDWVPPGFSTSWRLVSRGETRALFGLHIVYRDMDSLVILLGTMNLQVGFSVVLAESAKIGAEEQGELFASRFIPSPLGSTTVKGRHQVCVSANPLLKNDTKYYMVDVQLERLEGPGDSATKVSDAVEDSVKPESPPPNNHPPTVAQGNKWSIRSWKVGR